MDIGNVSPSKLKRIGLCEARAVAMVEEDVYDEDKHEGTLAGTLAHNAAKWWYRPSEGWVQAIASIADPAERERAKSSRVWNGMPKHVITNPDEAFKAAIKEVAGDQELPKEAVSVREARTLFEQIITYYRRDQINVVFCERRYKGQLKNGVPVHLIIDMALDRGNGQLDIVDFKTGYITIDDDEMWGDHQVLLNLLAVARDDSLNAYVKKSFHFFWVRSQYPSQLVSLTGDQLSDYEYWLMFEYQRLLNLNGDRARESVNRFCNSCFRRLKCTKYRELISEALGAFQAKTVEELQKLPANDIMEQVERLQLQQKQLEGFEKTLKADLEARLTRAGVKEILGDRLKARRRSMKVGGLDTGVVLALGKQYNMDITTLVSPRKRVCEDAFQGHPEALAQLSATARAGFSSTWIEVCALPKTTTKDKATT